MDRGFDDLYDSTPAFGRPWIAFTATPEQKAWCEDLADFIIKRGAEPPNWAAVHRKFESDFKGEPTPSDSTLRSTVRHLVEKRAE